MQLLQVCPEPSSSADDDKWTIWAPRPGSRALLTAILECHQRWEHLKSRREHTLAAGEDLGDAEMAVPALTELDVISVTGPGVFSRGVLDVLHADTGANETALSGLDYPCRWVRLTSTQLKRAQVWLVAGAASLVLVTGRASLGQQRDR